MRRIQQNRHTLRKTIVPPFGLWAEGHTRLERRDEPLQTGSLKLPLGLVLYCRVVPRGVRCFHDGDRRVLVPGRWQWQWRGSGSGGGVAVAVVVLVSL
jgi:hypothetical protein